MSNFSRSQANLAYGLFGLCLLLFRPSGANAEAPPAKDESARISAEATHIDHAPKLDGTLNDPLWQSAKPITEFRQREPHEGEPPTEKTEVRILYTRHAVYFGIYCYDSKTSRIVATELRRDVSQDLDDHFEILIDSNHNRRGAYVFEINPLGTQNDGLIVEEQGDTNGGDFDRGWDGVWTSEARITPDGWTATIQIPFTTLNFTQSSDVVWGLNLKRFVRRKNEEDLWSAYRRTFGITKVSEAGELRGIKDIGSGRLFIVKPYGLARYDRQTGENPKFPLTGGVDIKYGLTSNLVLNLTGNTDFADAEVDLQPFNLTPFKVFIPEKRQFFLENAGVFNFDIGDQDQLFFSRQIGIVADAMKLLPSEAETKHRWSTLEWSKERRGWLFLTSTPDTRKLLAPLISLWLDMLVLRLMNQGRMSPRPVWFILDELATLQRLPQLHTAITENRKSNNPVVLGFQGRSQLEVRYGHEAEAMMSQPSTKIFLCTSEPHAAKWISDAIGEQEIERIRESRTNEQFPQSRKSKGYNLEREIRPLVMASEISGLEKMHGYLKCGNLVVRLSLPYIELGSKERQYIERPAQQAPEEPPKVAAAAAGTGKPSGNGASGQELVPNQQQQSAEQKIQREPGRRQRDFFE